MKQQVGVWSGVKIGCGIFIVLPLIIIAAIAIVIMIARASFNHQKDSSQRVKTEQIQRK